MKNKSGKTIRIIIVSAAAVIAAAAGFAVYELMPDEVSVRTVSRSDITASISEIGNVICDDSVTIYAPVTGRIATVDAAVNDTVSEGSTLITYDLTSFEDTIAKQELNVNYHENGYNAAVSDNEKNKKTAGSAGGSADSLKQQYIETESAISQIETTQAEKNQYVQATIQGIEAAIADMNTELDIPPYAEWSKTAKRIGAFAATALLLNLVSGLIVDGDMSAQIEDQIDYIKANRDSLRSGCEIIYFDYYEI